MAAPKKIGVVGAGTMGSGIAQKTAQSGLDVVMMDMGVEQIDAGLSRIRSMLDQGVERGVFGKGEPERVMSRIRTTTDPKDMKDRDLIVEAVFENLDVKRGLFKELEKHVRPDTVLATNTSSFKVAVISEGASRPDRFIGLHYFFHPAKNRLLEVIPYDMTSKKTKAAALAFAEMTGKTAIASADSPGFVVNRFFVPWLNESVRLLEEGVADLPTIEKTAKDLFKIGMGPFQLMNVTGVPIAMHAADGLAMELGDFYKAADLLRKQVESKENWNLEGEASEKGVDEVRSRLLGVVLLVAAALVEDNVATPEDTDIGAKTGLRWPLGPFGMANKIGITESVKAAALVADKYGISLPKMIDSRMKQPLDFELWSVTTRVEKETAWITMNRPDVMNALDPVTVDHLAQAFDRVAADPSVKAIVIEGRGKAFVAGADIKFFLKAIEDNDINRIVDFTRTGHELFLRIDKCKKPVIARLNGLALGGGFELALACDAIVADTNAVLGFPETGIGIYPGLGGTQRTVTRCGKGVARYLVFSGDMVPATKAAELGLVDIVAEPGSTSEAVQDLLDSGRVHAGAGAGKLATPGKLKETYSEMFDDQKVASWLDGTVEPKDELEAKLKKKMSYKAPVAIKIAAELIEQGAGRPIEEGVELELSRLKEIFSTEDARVGLSSVGKTRPEFKGK
ncbi:MAG: 3-hydroxyacyl-CoA dehydrogenase/enoyl-CoA hydratase family protein [Deltaproteobacteria bacterium]|nr:3-hydroxyacyl-CoA dehydrogenase/enoyl-CoA hydratase family protein [Deltaproteobacteria bacterium]